MKIIFKNIIKKSIYKKMLVGFVFLSMFLSSIITISFIIKSVKNDLLMNNSINYAISVVDEKFNCDDIKDDNIKSLYKYTRYTANYGKQNISIGGNEFMYNGFISTASIYDNSLNYNEIYISSELLKIFNTDVIGKEISINYIINEKEILMIKNVYIKGICDDYDCDIIISSNINIENFPNKEYGITFLYVEFKEFNDSSYIDYLNDRYNISLENDNPEIYDLYVNIEKYYNVIRNVTITIFIISFLVIILYLFFQMIVDNYMNNDQNNMMYCLGMNFKKIIVYRIIEMEIINFISEIISMIFAIVLYNLVKYYMLNNFNISVELSSMLVFLSIIKYLIISLILGLICYIISIKSIKIKYE